jgi:hypothetical protein
LDKVLKLKKVYLCKNLFILDLNYRIYIKRQVVTLFMKKIVEYRKLLNVDKTAELKDLKTIYQQCDERIAS